ncbi:hypothetical protein PENSPDRAFT_732423 [Peniophora sp. CONT]|nr:hypothetical protein PENSPDRAFT_732423 [Peniophora sp. CONT]
MLCWRCSAREVHGSRYVPAYQRLKDRRRSAPRASTQPRFLEALYLTQRRLSFKTPAVSRLPCADMSSSELADTAVYAALLKLQHVACGLYIWEWAMSLDYEFQYIFGKRQWKWTMCPYLLCRYCILGFVITLLIVINTQMSLDCPAWVRFQLLLPYLGTFMSSFLIVIRAIAIWSRHPAVVLLGAASLIAQLSALIHSVVVAKAIWDVDTHTCVLQNSIPASLPTLSGMFAVDALQLLVMLVGLYRWRNAHGSGVWKLLWKQGLLWLALAAAAELPTIIILTLNVDDALHQLLQTPEVIILALAATNMYRALADYSPADSRCRPPPPNAGHIELGVCRRTSSRAFRSISHSQAVKIEIRVEHEREFANAGS